MALAVTILFFFWLNSTNWFRFKLAEAYEKQGKDKSAVKTYEKIIRRSELKRGSISRFYGQRLTQRKKYKLVKKIADYHYENNDTRAALKYYRILEKIAPENSDEFLNLYILTGDIDKLVEAALNSDGKKVQTKVQAKDLDSSLWKYKLGIGLIEKMRWQEAKETFLDLISDHAYLSTFRYYLGYTFQELGMAERAKEEFKIARSLNPDYDFFSENGRIANTEPVFDFAGIWNFDRDEDNILIDSSGRENHCKIYEAEHVRGINGSALGFDGIDDTVIMPDGLNAYFNNKDFTIAVWVKPITQRKNRFIYSKRFVFLGFCEENDFWGFGLRDSEGSKNIVIRHPVENKWYFAVQCVKQNEYHKAYLFDKTRLIATLKRENIRRVIEPNDRPFVLSKKGQSSLNNAYFKGDIDEVMIFNRALASNEIQLLYENFAKDE